MSDEKKEENPETGKDAAEMSEKELEMTAGGIRMTPLSLGGIGHNLVGNTIGGATLIPSGGTIIPSGATLLPGGTRNRG